MKPGIRQAVQKETVMSMYMSEHFKTHGVELRKALGDLQVGNIGGGCFHNGSWFNGSGVKIGWGDLSWSQVLSFPALLPKGEMLFLVDEHPSHWYMPQDRDRKFPGFDWILCNTRIFVSELLYRQTGQGVVKVRHERTYTRYNVDGADVVARFERPDVEWDEDPTAGVTLPLVNRRKFSQLVMANWSCDYEKVWCDGEGKYKNPCNPLTDPSVWSVDEKHRR